MQMVKLSISVIIMILLVTGCAEGDVSNHTFPNAGNLEVLFDINEVKDVTSAKTFEADFIELDPAQVADNFIKGPIIRELTDAFGYRYEAEGSMIEYLTIYDGGEAFGVKGAVNGGFYYTWHPSDRLTDYQEVVLTSPGPPDESTQLTGYQLRDNFLRFDDLAFTPYIEAKDDVMHQLSEVGIEGIEIDMIYSLDYETMNANRDIYLNDFHEGDEREMHEWLSEEEAYLMHFRQVVEDIPLINVNWQNRPRGAQEITETIITAIYMKQGVHSLEVSGFYDIGKQSEAKPIISKEEALKELNDHFATVLSNEQTRIEDMELNYISLLNEGSYRLVPAWVFLLAKEAETEATEIADAEVYTNYQYYIIHAISGERIFNAGGDTE